MPKFLFWNINRHDIAGFVRHVAREADADLLILAECRIKLSKLLETLNDEKPHYHYAWGACRHLLFLTRFPPDQLKPLRESPRVSVRSLTMDPHKSILIAAAHLPSKMNYSDESQFLESVALSRMIDEAEAKVGHYRTVLMGDLNMNPFEPGMIGARGGLHAVMNRRIAMRDNRVVQKKKYKFFYNPMWNHLGDTGAGGTFFFENAEPVCYFWNMFDQVLLRPDLLHRFSPKQVRILTEVRKVPLVDSEGRPDKEMASDHLPVLLELKF